MGGGRVGRGKVGGGRVGRGKVGGGRWEDVKWREGK